MYFLQIFRINCAMCSSPFNKWKLGTANWPSFVTVVIPFNKWKVGTANWPSFVTVVILDSMPLLWYFTQRKISVLWDVTPYSLVYISKKAAASSIRCHIAQRKPVVDRRLNRSNNIQLCIRLHNLKYAFSNNMLDFWIIRSEPLTWYQHKHLE